MLLPIPSTAKKTRIEGKIPLIILGSTGSIGKNTLNILEQNRNDFELIGLSANSNFKLFAEQVNKFKPKYAVLANENFSKELLNLVSSQTKLTFGENALVELSQNEEATTVVAGIVGFQGLKTVLTALESGKRVCLANKESIVSGRNLVESSLKKGQGEIIPVDSEHSAIFQCIQGLNHKTDILNLIITASGGPFFGKTKEYLRNVQPKDALNHPNWSMGKKVTIDSATLFNKGLELIEASYLFDIPEERIKVHIHPQSIVHSMVETVDGSSIAQLGIPDMKVPIAYSLSYPEKRFVNVESHIDLLKQSKLDFFAVDSETFPSIELSREALRTGGSATCVLNSSNEFVVEDFLAGKISFLDIFSKVENAFNKFSQTKTSSYNELLELHGEIEKFIKA